jgi:hypothetical protein
MRRLLIVIAFACGCSSGGMGMHDLGTAGGGDLAGTPAPDFAGGTLDLARAPRLDMGGAGGGGSGGGGGGALYPIALGNRWTYTVAAVGAGSVCAAGSYDQAIVSANPGSDGRPAFQMTSFCSGVAGTQDVSTPGGDEVDAFYNGAWAPFVALPLMEGYSWQYFNATYKWHREGTITVPAGTFDDCWTANQQVSYTAYLTYCRGAGLVHSYSSDLSGSGWDAKLASKSF